MLGSERIEKDGKKMIGENWYNRMVGSVIGKVYKPKEKF